MSSQADVAARVLMGDSLGFHIIFVLFGLTLPILVCWFEWLGIRRQDKRYLDTAHLWSKIMALLVVTGVISGTVIALQMSLVWPGILKFGGQVIGLPFMFETYAFLIEAVFLALYITTWRNKKISPYLHLLFGLFVVLGSTMSAYAITSVNAWMNLPTGFTFVHGKLTNIQVFHAMFSETALIEFFHSMPGYYIAACLFIAGIYGIKLLRQRKYERLSARYKFDWVIIHKLLLFTAVSLAFSIATGDMTGKYLAHHEPAKLATLEVVNRTETHAPFVFGGFETANGQLTGPYIKVPDALSIMVGESPTTVIKGIEIIPAGQRPPSYIRVLFNIKLTLITGLLIGLIAYFLLKYSRPKWLASPLPLALIAVGSVVGIIIVELGWMITEIGRQPWAVHGYVTTAQALTTHKVDSFGYIFPTAFLLLFAVTILAVIRIVREHKALSTNRGQL